MILPNCDLPNALQRANEVREIIASTPVFYSGVEKPITMSMGVAVSACEGKTDVEILLNQADAGLYAAKANGRNRIEHFTPVTKKTSPVRARKS
jgi:diguanylate cyclase (GGDEF)-like protein